MKGAVKEWKYKTVQRGGGGGRLGGKSVAKADWEFRVRIETIK